MSHAWVICFILLAQCFGHNVTENLMGIGSAPFRPIFSLPGGVIRTSKTTVVCAHFTMPFSKHAHEKYRAWWKNTLRLNSPYVFYTNDVAAAKLALDIRQGLPTIVVYKNYSSFFGFGTVNRRHTHPLHVPSVPLALVWLEKTFLVKDALRRNYFKSEWFAWVDSGVALYRKIEMPFDPWPNPSALEKLPPKFLYTCKWFPWDLGEIAGSAFMYHKNVVQEITKLWIEAHLECMDDAKRPPTLDPWICNIDQYLLTVAKSRRPDLFYQTGYGYGVLVRDLFKNDVPEKNITRFDQVCQRASPEDGCHWLIEMPK